MQFLQNLAWGRKSRVHTLMPNFIIVALKMWSYSPQKLRKMVTVGINLPLRKNSGGRQKKLNIGAVCTTTNPPLCNDTIIVLKITLLHSFSVITNFIIQSTTNRLSYRYRQKIHHNFSSTAGARPTSPPYLAGDRGGPYHFCAP